MPKIKFTSALRTFFPDLGEMVVHGDTVKEIIFELEKKFPGISDYLLSEDGQLRKHVNVFLTQDLIKDRQFLSDKVDKDDEILIYQALSGG